MRRNPSKSDFNVNNTKVNSAGTYRLVMPQELPAPVWPGCRSQPSLSCCWCHDLEPTACLLHIVSASTDWLSAPTCFAVSPVKCSGSRIRPHSDHLHHCKTSVR